MIEDDSSDQAAFKQLIGQESSRFSYAVAGSVSEARDIMDSEMFDVVITNYLLVDGTAFDIFDFVTDVPIIVVTRGGNEGVAVKAMKAGAYDYLIKDPEYNYLKVLPVTIENAIKRKKAEERLRLL